MMECLQTFVPISVECLAKKQRELELQIPLQTPQQKLNSEQYYSKKKTEVYHKKKVMKEFSFQITDQPISFTVHKYRRFFAVEMKLYLKSLKW